MEIFIAIMSLLAFEIGLCLFLFFKKSSFKSLTEHGYNK